MAMSGRERIRVALEGGVPDRVPRALAFFHVDLKGLAPRRDYRADLIDVQFIRFPPTPEEKQLQRRFDKYPADTRLGNPLQMATYTRWKYAPETPESRNPLAHARSLENLRDFSFPDAPSRDTKKLAQQVEKLHEQGLAAGGGLPHLGGELFETAWRLRGLENFLIDLVKRPDWAHYLLDRLTELACRNVTALAEAGIDVLALDDDVGMPGAMMIGPPTWAEFFKPRLARIIETARLIRPEIQVLYHSDGYFEPIIGGLTEIGVDAVNPIQPEHMNAERIRKRFGRRPALWGTVGRQTTFSFSSPDEIRDEVRQRVETLGRAGLVLCPAYDIDEPDIPWENIAAFLAAVEEYG
jgi:uroporphyrinogen decarboxylase